MHVNHMGVAVQEHANHMSCRTKVKMDDLWECLAEVHVLCPDLITCGPAKYCVHKKHARFRRQAEGDIQGALK
jgi:hypothetical protein